MMIELDNAAILDLWEAGQGRYPFERAVMVLERAGTAAAADLTLTERDRALLALHGALFRPVFDLVADCPNCGARLELELATDDLAALLRRPSPPPPPGVEGIAFRDPTSHDLAALVRAADPAAELRQRLAGRDALPEAARMALDGWIDTRLAEAEIRLNLSCAECDGGWSETLDIPGCLWSEIETVARRVLREVAELARCFGWSEEAILALGPLRRQAYLALARAS